MQVPLGPGTLMCRPSDPGDYLERETGEQSGLRQSLQEEFEGSPEVDTEKGTVSFPKEGFWPCGRIGRRVPGRAGHLRSLQATVSRLAATSGSGFGRGRAPDTGP